MRLISLQSCIAAAIATTLGSGALAQMPPPPPGAPAAAAGSAYAATTETRGTVQHFTLNPGGEIDGLLLADGTEVHFPPHLSAALAAAVRVGDSVTVQGYRSTYAPVVEANSLTDGRSGQSVVDTGPPPPGSMPPPAPPGVPAAGSREESIQSRVVRALHGPAGDVNGALLADGTIVRVPPPAAYQAASLLNPGQTLAVQGYALTTSYGKVMDVQAIGSSTNQMTPVAPMAGAPGAPPPPPPGGPPPPPPGAGAPPPPTAGAPPPPPQ